MPKHHHRQKYGISAEFGIRLALCGHAVMSIGAACADSDAWRGRLKCHAAALYNRCGIAVMSNNLGGVSTQKAADMAEKAFINRRNLAHQQASAASSEGHSCATRRNERHDRQYHTGEKKQAPQLLARIFDVSRPKC